MTDAAHPDPRPLRPVMDPGWRPALASTPLGLLLNMPPQDDSSPPRALTRLRRRWVLLCDALFLPGVVLLVASGTPAAKPPTAWPVQLPLAVAFALVGVSLLLRERRLDQSSLLALRNSYTRIFWARFAFLAGALVAGVAIALVAETLWSFVASAAPAFAGYLSLAPTSRDVRRHQQRLSASGSPLSLLEALS